MKKDAIRDYATEAFRFYASIGKPSYRSLKAKYMADALESYQREHQKGNGIGKPTEAAVLYAEKNLDKKAAELLDVLAVEKVYNIADDEVKKIIEIVYFEEPKKPLNKGEISNRVQKACMETFNSERSIYYILKSVRLNFAEERGLRY